MKNSTFDQIMFLMIENNIIRLCVYFMCNVRARIRRGASPTAEKSLSIDTDVEKSITRSVRTKKHIG